MSTEIANYSPLIFASSYDGETYLKQCTLQQWHKISDSDFVSFEGGIEIRKNQIKSVGNATSAQYFEVNVLPGLSEEYKREYNSIKQFCPKDIKHSTILESIKRKAEERKYYEDMDKPMTKEQIEQRKKIVELYKTKLGI